MKRRPGTPTDTDRSPENEDAANFRTPVSKHKRLNANYLSVSSNITSNHSMSVVDGPSSAKVNPFERHILANLHRPFWSPSIFPQNASLMETPPMTSWAIDQLSVLFPKAIEDSPSTHQNTLKLTPSTEAKAQADIERFFSQDCVLPSPVVPILNPNNSTNTLMGAMEISNSPCLNIVKLVQHTQSKSSCTITSASQSSGAPKIMMDSWTSTSLSLPPQLPPHIEAILQPYLKCSENESLSSTTYAVREVPIVTWDNHDTGLNKKTGVLAPCLSLNSSNNGGNSRRRRLAFSSTDEDEDENRRCNQLDFSYEEFSPSPMNISANSPLMMTPSRVHSSPSSYFVKDGFNLRRSENTPCNTSRLDSLMSPNLTPIRRPYAFNKSATAKMLDLTQD